jgi:hypothetical protein
MKVTGYPRDQIGQILRILEPARSAGTMAYRGAPEEDGAGLYRSGTQIDVLTIPMCCMTKEDHHEGRNRPRSTS